MAKTKRVSEDGQPIAKVVIVLHHHVHHDGEHFRPGERIELDENAAQALIAVHAAKLAEPAHAAVAASDAKPAADD